MTQRRAILTFAAIEAAVILAAVVAALVTR
jgi:hypothetical protein